MIQAKKSEGLDAVIRNFTVKRLEENRPLAVQGSLVLSALIQEYKQLISHPARDHSWVQIEELYRLTEHIDVILTPEEIRTLTPVILFTEGESDLGFRGVFLNRLIQNSYNQGYNNFNVDLLTIATLHVGSYLNAEEKRPLRLSVKNGKGFLYAAHANNLHLDVNIEVFGYAHSVKNSQIMIEGNAATGLGNHSYRTTFHVKGNVYNALAKDAQESTYIIDGDFEVGPNSQYSLNSARQCIFKARKMETAQKLSDNLIQGGDNLVYLLNPDGTEQLMRDFQ